MTESFLEHPQGVAFFGVAAEEIFEVDEDVVGGAGAADFDGNELVDGADLGRLLSAWGPVQ